MSRLEFKALKLINGVRINGGVSEGEFLIILGRNGSGKSLFLKTLTGLIPARSGSILLDGTPLSEALLKRRKAGLGGLFSYVPQSFQTGFPLTVRETVILGRARGVFGRGGRSNARAAGGSSGAACAENDADGILKRLGIWHLRDSYTDRISGGELALVSLARALMQGGRFLVLDEPEANLDVSKKAEFYRLIRGLMRTDRGCGQSCEYIDDNGENSVDSTVKPVNNIVDKNADKAKESLPGIVFVTHDPLFALNLGDYPGFIGAFLRNGEFREFSARELTAGILEDIYATPAEIRVSNTGIRYPVFSELLGSLA
ncbi:ABC transporter ATP-binding protein [Succinimonas sp.]|uniref:ABC transporter ATP-binding protein n=1 Tax=Succinimonas sp. TaxID=1936151 RepID=UPI00386F6E55